MANKRISDLTQSSGLLGTEKFIIDQESTGSISGLTTVQASLTSVKDFTLSAANFLEVCGHSDLAGITNTNGINTDNILASGKIDTVEGACILSGGRDLSVIFGGGTGGGTLQSVTNAGNITNNEVIIRNNMSVRDVLSAGAIYFSEGRENPNIIENFELVKNDIIGGGKNFTYASASNTAMLNTSASNFGCNVLAAGNITNLATIIGGESLSATARNNILIGGCKNIVHEKRATIIGGICNEAYNDCLQGVTYINSYSALNEGKTTTHLGGCCNKSTAEDSIIIGGSNNEARSSVNSAGTKGGQGCQTVVIGTSASVSENNFGAVIGGGHHNLLGGGNSSVIIGGSRNTITHGNDKLGRSAILGGSDNCILSGDNSTISGGLSNLIDHGNPNCSNQRGGTIGGGHQNKVYGNWGTIGGGIGNEVKNSGSSNANKFTTIAGGCQNIADSIGATIAGGYNNTICSNNSTIAGGKQNCTITGNCTFIGGGFANIAEGNQNVIAGGNTNFVKGLNSSVLGGKCNQSNQNYSTVVGGELNCALSAHSGIVSGKANLVCAKCSFIGGGQSNQTKGLFSGILGGYQNILQSNADCSFIIGQNIQPKNSSHNACRTFVNNLSGGCGSYIEGRTIVGGAANAADTDAPALSATGGSIMGTISAGSSVLHQGNYITLSAAGGLVGNSLSAANGITCTIPTTCNLIVRGGIIVGVEAS
jgi:hypothetical protein